MFFSRTILMITGITLGITLPLSGFAANSSTIDTANEQFDLTLPGVNPPPPPIKHEYRSKPGKAQIMFNKMRVKIIDCEADLRMITISNDKAKELPEVDFTKERLALLPVHLRSSKIQIENPSVNQDGDSYLLSYEFYSPRVVSTDFKNSIIWYVLPKDALPIDIFHPSIHTRAIPFYNFDAGVIDRAAIRFNPKE